MNEKVEAIITHKATPNVVFGICALGNAAYRAYKDIRKVKTEPYENPQLTLDFGDDEEEPYLRSAEDVVRAAAIIDEEDYRDDSEVEAPVEIVPIDAPDPEPQRRVIFADNSDEWDYTKELLERTENKPYVLHKDEFFENALDHTQATLCYYQRDDIMCDENNTPVYDYPKIVGDLRFGHGSDDPNVFYVRNSQNNAEFEVLLHTGSFAEEILGVAYEEQQEEELKHSSGRRYIRED